MDSSKLNFRCIVCDLDTSSLCNLHKHQSTNHTSEELSLSILTLQSFLYHKHYFQSLDSKPLTDLCYFYPFCTQVFSEKGKNNYDNFKTSLPSHETTVVKTECIASPATELPKTPKPIIKKSPKKQVSLRLPMTTVTRPTIIKSLAKQSPPVTSATSTNSDTHGAFLNSANALCDDLIKLKGHKSQSKTKRKRLNEKKDRPRPLKQDNKQMVKKPARKPKIDKAGKKINTVPKISTSENLESLNIWASKSEESISLDTVNNLSGATLIDNVQPINLQSPTVPIDMLNCENALVFNAETGSFQWNPLVFIEKKPEEKGPPLEDDVPQSALPNQITYVPNLY